MATELADFLFYVVAAAILVSQVFILRSTARGMRWAASASDTAGAANARRTALEWLYAIGPAIVLVALLMFSWRAMHPDSIEVQGVAPGIRQS